MFRNRTILFWFREPQWIPVSHFINSPFNECSGFIPVFCFDEREKQFFANEHDYLRFRNDTIEYVAEIRQNLQVNGSNLLIVNGSYDILIPSLSRVLQAEEVIAITESTSQNVSVPGLSDFRDLKTREIQHALKMHSISMKIQKNPKPSQTLPESVILPPFPPINPGKVPVKAFHESEGN